VNVFYINVGYSYTIIAYSIFY